MDQKEYKKNDNKIFFIVGRGRSGTTLLMSLLNAHPQIAVAPEGLFMLNMYSKYGRVKNWNKKKIENFFADIWKEKYMNIWNLDKDSLKKELLNLGPDTTFQELCRTVYICCARQQKNRIDISGMLIGDKNPHYSLSVNKLSKLFPEAKFIYITRDYRDNILSYRKMKFEMNGVGTLAYRWKKYNKIILKQTEKNKNNFLFIKYEDLLTNPEKELSKAVSFLGVGYDPVMTSFYKNTPSYLDEWCKKVVKPIDKNECGKWKTELKEKEIAVADFICGKMGKQFGYQEAGYCGSFFLFFSTVPAFFYATFYTLAEQVLFILPFWLRSCILNYFRRIKYRKLSGIKF